MQCSPTLFGITFYWVYPWVLWETFAIFNMMMTLSPSQTRDQEDFLIMKLIIYLFEGSSRLAINYNKSCLYSMNFEFQPSAFLALILNCTRDCFPLTYLRVPILGRHRRRQDWTKLTSMVRAKLSSWKVNYLSLRDRVTLLNSILSFIPTYWMSILKLSC